MAAKWRLWEHRGIKFGVYHARGGGCLGKIEFPEGVERIALGKYDDVIATALARIDAYCKMR